MPRSRSREGRSRLRVPHLVESGPCARSRGDHFRPNVEPEVAGRVELERAQPGFDGGATPLGAGLPAGPGPKPDTVLTTWKLELSSTVT